MRPRSFLVAIVLFTSITARAEVQTYKDWMVTQAADEVFQKDACVTGTNVSVGTNPAQVSLSFTTDQASVPQLLVKVWNQTDSEEKLFIKVSSKVQYPLFLWKKAIHPEEPSVYWYAPIGWSPLMDYIAAANNLSIKGTQTDLALSLKGSSVTLDRVKKCLKAKEILPLDFLKKLNTKTETLADLLPSVEQMIEANEKTFETYRKGLSQTNELNELRKESSKVLKQEEVALEELSTAERRLTRSEEALKAEQENQSQLQSQLSEAQTDRVQLEAKLSPAQKIEAEKKAVYEPLKAQLQPFIKEVQSRIAAVERNQSNESSLKNRISQNERRLSELESDRSYLNSQISNLERDTNSARRDYEQARSEADRYDVEREIRNDFDRFAVDRERQAGRDHERNANQMEGRLNSLRGEIRSLEADLRNCDPEKGKLQCTAIRLKLTSKRGDLQKVEDESRRARERARNSFQNADRMEQSIRSRHQSKKTDLQRTADYEYNQYRSVASQLDQVRSRYESVRRDIPNVQGEISSLKSQLRSVRNEQPGLQAALDESRRKRDDYKKQIGFDKAEAEYQAAQNNVIQIQKGIATAKATIETSEKGLKKSAAALVELNKDLIAKKETQKKALTKLAPIQEQLKPFREKEAVLTASIQKLAEEFDHGKAQYQRTYESWIQDSVTQTIQMQSYPATGTF